MLDTIIDLVENVERAQTPHEVLDVLEASARRYDFGVEWFCIALPVRPGDRFEDRMLTSRQPPGWLDLYLKENYCQSDAALRHCRHVVEPFRWLDAPYDPEREPKFAEVVCRAKDFKVDQGLMTPVPGPTGCVGSLWAGGPDLQLLDRFKPSLYAIGLYTFHKVMKLVDPAVATKAVLTEREREILTWVAIGKSAWDISEILNISNRTVEWHIQQAAKKLRAVNRTQAVVLAARDGLITI